VTKVNKTVELFETKKQRSIASVYRRGSYTAKFWRIWCRRVGGKEQPDAVTSSGM